MRRIVWVVGLAAVTLAACSGGGDRAAKTSSGAGRGSEARATKGTAAVTADGTRPATPRVTGQQVISTAQLHVRVDRVGDASERAITIVESIGGSLFSQHTDIASRRDATLVFKVPPAEFQTVLRELGAIGSVRQRQVATEDVTERVVDLDGRLKTASASADRLRSLFDTATDVNAIVAVESALAQREAEIESLQGQLRVLQSQVQLATVELTLTRAVPPPVETHIPGFAAGLAAGWDAFVAALAVSVTAVGAALPFAVTLGALAALAVAVRRRRRRAQPHSVEA